MKTIQSLEMDEELVTSSPSAAMPESPNKTEDDEENVIVEESHDDKVMDTAENASPIAEESGDTVQAAESEDTSSLRAQDPVDASSPKAQDPEDGIPVEDQVSNAKENIMTTDSLEDALNQQLAELEDDEEETAVEEINESDAKEPEVENEEVSQKEESVANNQNEETANDVEQIKQEASGLPKDDGGESTEDEAVESVDEEESGQSDTNEEIAADHAAEPDAEIEAENDDDSAVDPTEENESTMDAEAEEETAPKETVNLEDGLMALQQIMQNFKNLEDETCDDNEKSGQKRSLNTEESTVAKRSKMETPDLKKRISKELKKLSRTEIEDLVSEKIVEMISTRSEIGDLRQKCDSYRDMNEKWRRKMQALQKMCQDLNTVMRRYITDVQKEKEKVAPIKITRSVGLQVLTDRNRRISTPTLTPPQVAAKRTFPMMPPAKPPTIIHTNPGTSVVSMPNGISITRQPIPANFIQRPVLAPSSAVMSKAPVTVNISPAGIRPLHVANGLPVVRTQVAPQPDASKKVIDIVDLDDDDDVTPAMPNQVVIPTSQLRLIPANQLQQQGLAYAVVSSANSSPAGLNRVLVARPTTSGQILVSRNVNGVVARPTQPTLGSSRPVVIQAQPRPIMSQGLRPIAPMMHPAPLPEVSQVLLPQNPGWKRSPPKPKLKISRLKTGIVLSWNMDISLQEHANVNMYQIFAYQETAGLLPAMSLWKKVGDVKALPLPMACTLTQFTKGNKYHFAIRAQDVHGRIGLFSDPQCIALT